MEKSYCSRNILPGEEQESDDAGKFDKDHHSLGTEKRKQKNT
jgi:hypothetical protein